MLRTLFANYTDFELVTTSRRNLSDFERKELTDLIAELGYRLDEVLTGERNPEFE